MNINSTIKSEVLKYMEKSLGATHTSLAWNRKVVFAMQEAIGYLCEELDD